MLRAREPKTYLRHCLKRKLLLEGEVIPIQRKLGKLYVDSAN
jgi:hypothetical protein